MPQRQAAGLERPEIVTPAWLAGAARPCGSRPGAGAPRTRPRQSASALETTSFPQGQLEPMLRFKVMTKAIIFDLDSCLSAADEPGQDLFAPAFDAITRATTDSHPPTLLQQAFADMWRLPFDFVANKYNFTAAMRSAGWNVFLHLEVTTPMQGYGDLTAIQDLPARRFLVTSGFRRLQESKIRALGIAPLFTAIFVDAIDQPGHRGKQRIFEDILRDFELQPSEVLIVGDNHDSEIAAGGRLGIRTVQTLRPGVPPSPAATHNIQTLHQLRPLLDLTP